MKFIPKKISKNFKKIHTEKFTKKCDKLHKNSAMKNMNFYRKLSLGKDQLNNANKILEKKNNETTDFFTFSHF